MIATSSSLGRLAEGKYLVRLDRPHRAIGGVGGGSGQYVYQLGPAGWRLLERDGRYWAFRKVDNHTLAIADLYVSLTRAERTGRLAIVEYRPEPACHVTIGGVKLEPDAYMEIGIHARGLKYPYFVEVDLASEHTSSKGKIETKLKGYWHAYRQATPEQHFPLVLFTVPDETRQQAIQRVVARGPNAARALFYVVPSDQIADWLVTEAPALLAAISEA